MTRIAIVYDVEGWAWHKRACAIQKYAGCDVDMLNHSESMLEKSPEYAAMATHIWQSSTRGLCDKQWAIVTNGKLQYPYNPWSEDFRNRCASRSNNENLASEFLPRFHGIICINPVATEFCRTLNANTVQLRPGVDTDVYYPEAVQQSDRMRVGWCGKPSEPGRFSSKGFHEILLPLMERHPDIDWQVNTRHVENALGEQDMRRWYASLDLFLVTSSAEGTPSTALEALSCGTPVAGTPVGIIPQLAEDGAAIHLCRGYTNENEAAQTVGEFDMHLRFAPLTRRDPGVVSRNRKVIEEKWPWKKLASQWVETMLS